MNAPSHRFVVGTHEGRLLEARVLSLVTGEDVDRFAEALRDTLDLMPPGPAVLCADHRWANIYPQAVTDRLVDLFLAMNTRLERVAIVVGSAKPTFFMQMRRVAREAENEARQVFQDPDAALQHLGRVLSPPELARARAFLAEPPPDPS